ncbi:hypothetical protein LCGC14_1907480, partial [marine sediment metagenome]
MSADMSGSGSPAEAAGATRRDF